jgi:hypothetical protein
MTKMRGSLTGACRASRDRDGRGRPAEGVENIRSESSAHYRGARKSAPVVAAEAAGAVNIRKTQ